MSDLISRQAVLKLLSAMPPEEAITKAMLIQSVKQMDAAQPDRKRGKWVRGIGEYAKKLMECSECRRTFYYNAEWNFCPHCGAKMEVNDGSD